MAGGAGGGSGEGNEPGQTGGGGGFGLGARPVGAYVIAGDQVRWEPAVDVSRIATQAIVGVCTVAALGILLLGRRRA